MLKKTLTNKKSKASLSLYREAFFTNILKFLLNQKADYSSTTVLI
jgi:hypothetical protein